MSVESLDPDYVDQVFEYHKSAYEHSQRSDFEDAATMWQAILDDDDMSKCFTSEGLKEIAYNCAAAYYFAGKVDEYDDIVSDHGIDDKQCEEIRKAAEED